MNDDQETIHNIVQRPTDTKIMIRREDDMLIVSVPEVACPCEKNLFLEIIGVVLWCFVIEAGIVFLTFSLTESILVVLVFCVMFLPLLIAWLLNPISGKKKSSKQTDIYSAAATVIFRKEYFVIMDMQPSEGKYFYIRGCAPAWGDVCPHHGILYAVYIPCRPPGETPIMMKEHECYDIICNSAEEAQWLLQKIKEFLDPFPPLGDTDITSDSSV